MTTSTKTKSSHRPAGSARYADRCTCGAQIVFFENSKATGYGCESFGRATRAFEISEEN